MIFSLGKHEFMVSAICKEIPNSLRTSANLLDAMSLSCLSTERVYSGVPATLLATPPAVHSPRNECILTCFAPNGSPLQGAIT